MLGISERSLGRWRAELEAQGLVIKKGARWVYRREGLEAAYLSVAGLQRTNADTHERLRQRVAATTRQPEPSIDDEDIPDPGDNIPPWAESKAKREHFLAEKERLSFQRTQGKLVDREAVGRFMFEETRRARDALQRLSDPGMCAALKYCAGDMGQMGLLLQEKIHEILIELSSDHERNMKTQVRKQQQEANK